MVLMSINLHLRHQALPYGTCNEGWAYGQPLLQFAPASACRVYCHIARRSGRRLGMHSQARREAQLLHQGAQSLLCFCRQSCRLPVKRRKGKHHCEHECNARSADTDEQESVAS